MSDPIGYPVITYGFREPMAGCLRCGRTICVMRTGELRRHKDYNSWKWCRVLLTQKKPAPDFDLIGGKAYPPRWHDLPVPQWNGWATTLICE